MRRGAVFLVFVISLSLVASMDSSITVKTNPGDHVKLYAWTSGSGPLLVMKEGVAEEGNFTVTFFSLSEERVDYQVIVLRGGEKVRDDEFEDYTTSERLLINCLPATCAISIYDGSEDFSENYQVSEGTPEADESEEAEDSFNFFDDYILRNIWIIGIVFFAVVLFVAIVFLVFFFRRKEKFYDREEKELEELQRKIKEKAEEIRKIKEDKFRKQRIYEAKRKLAEEEREIKELKEKRINEAKKNLVEKEVELRRLKEDEAKMISERKNQKDASNKTVVNPEPREPEKKLTDESPVERKTPLYDNSNE